MLKIASHEKNCGLESKDGSGFRAKPGTDGTFLWPESREKDAEAGVKSGLFVIVGRQFGGFGEGHWGKSYRTEKVSE